VVYKIDKELCQFNTKLAELSVWYKFNNKHVEKLRIEFRLQISNLEKEKRFKIFKEELRKVLQKEKIFSSSKKKNYFLCIHNAKKIFYRGAKFDEIFKKGQKE